MPKVKLNRKGTHIDMTAMCDVVFLLLNFFIMTTKFKPTEPVVINNPSSISQDELPKSNALITLDKDGRLFYTVNDEDVREELIGRVEDEKGVNLSEDQVQQFVKNGFVGTPIAQLPQFLSLSGNKLTDFEKTMPGITPIDTNAGLDINKDEFTYWLVTTRSIKPDITFALKVDQNSKYADLKKVLGVLSKNQILKFKFITNVENIPAGTAAYNEFQASRQKTK